MGNVVEQGDMVAFHPGYYIADVIEDSGVSLGEFAKKLDISAENLRRVVNGEVSITSILAKRLSELLGTGEEVWFNLQSNFDEKVEEMRDFNEI